MKKFRRLLIMLSIFLITVELFDNTDWQFYFIGAGVGIWFNLLGKK